MSLVLSAGWVETELGRLFVACTDAGLCRIELQPERAQADFDGWHRRVLPEHRLVEATPLLRQASDELASFAHGARRTFDVPLDLYGTAFQRSVWSELIRIPFGTTRTYGQVASAIGNPAATRAVGLANNRNPVPIVVPCHRVVAANGMGGFGGGLAMKHRLLALEGVHLSL